MKASTTLVALATWAAAADARNLVLPAATKSAALPLDGFSPKPTAPPGLHALVRRASNSLEPETVLVAPDATCGYISGRPGAAYTCVGTSATCVFFTSAATRVSGAIACCDDLSCNIRVGCIDYKGFYSSSECDGGCQVDAFTLKCTNTLAPYCNTISIDGGIQDFWCNNIDISTAQMAMTTYKGETDSRSFEPLALTDTSSSELFTITSGTINAGASVTDDVSTTTTTGDGGKDESTAKKDEDSGSKTPIGAIVGGVVGGVGAIGLIGLAAFFILRRKKPANQQSPPPYQAPPMQQQQPPPQPPPQPNSGPQGYAVTSPQGYHDPKIQQPHPTPNQQFVQPAAAGGYYPDSIQPSSPTVTDPRMSLAATSPTPSQGSYAVPPGQQPSPSQQLPGFQPQQTIHEAPAAPMDHHRGQMHELA